MTDRRTCVVAEPLRIDSVAADGAGSDRAAIPHTSQ